MPNQNYPDSDAWSRTLIEQAADLIVIVDRDGRVQYINQSITRVLGYPRDELLGRALEDLVHPDNVESFRSAFERTLGHPGLGPTCECRFRHENGSYRRLEMTSCNLLDDSQVGGIVLGARDVTSRSQLEEQLQQIQKREAVAQLTSGIAHDFNNILSIVMANVDLIAEAIPQDLVDAQRDLEDIRSSAQSGAEMIKKLLGFTRQADVVPTVLDPRQVVSDLASLLNRLLPESIHVEVDTSEPVGFVRVDPTSVEQILLNLATNARDAMPDGGTLRIDVRQAEFDQEFCSRHAGSRPGEYVCVSVADTGTGMHEETLAKVFNPFFTTKPAGKGTGLGLSMIYGLVKQHQGYVDVESAIGEGTTVRIFFPLVKEARHVRATRFSLLMVRPGTETVLFVEDNDALRRAGKRALQKFGYTVLTARDGQEALDAFLGRGGEIDLVVTDVVMPGIDGTELHAELRRRGETVRFVFSSGYAPEEVRKNIGDADDIVFLHKPWTIDELARTVREALDFQS